MITQEEREVRARGAEGAERGQDAAGPSRGVLAAHVRSKICRTLERLTERADDELERPC